MTDVTSSELRELDQRIAIEVMDVPVFAPLPYEGYCGPDLVEEHTGRECPRYSEDIASAWMVVEKMHAERWFVEIQFNNWGAKSWHVTFTRTTDDPAPGPGYVAWTESTAPLAICKAALAAKTSLSDPGSFDHAHERTHT